jgi:peptidoglycan/LPS O-acetylase OafA/YrhL
LTGARALALLHVLALHAALLVGLRSLGPQQSPALTPEGAALVPAFLRSWLAQPLMTGNSGVDTFFVL